MYIMQFQDSMIPIIYFCTYLHASSIHLWAKCPPSQVKQLKHLSSARSPNPPLICTGQRSHASWWRAQLACWDVRSCSCFRAPTGRLGDPWSGTCGPFAMVLCHLCHLCHLYNVGNSNAISVWLAGVWPLQKQGTSSANSVLWFDTRRCLLANHAAVPAPGLGDVGWDSTGKVGVLKLIPQG